MPLLRKAVVAAQDRPELKLQLARVLFASDQTAELIDLLKPSLTDDDAPPELLYWLGRAAMARGNDQLALVALRSAAAKGMANAFILSQRRSHVWDGKTRRWMPVWKR